MKKAVIKLTRKQHEALANNGAHPVSAVDPATNARYVLVPAEVYERLKAVLADETSDTAALINEVMAEDDANDPYLESYQRYAQDAP